MSILYMRGDMRGHGNYPGSYLCANRYIITTEFLTCALIKIPYVTTGFTATSGALPNVI